ncbi:MAG: dTMP kinase [Elusimicrobiota bacterium]|jgi:dTMP kinase|nr:dTMP kinase [Elusimicrobiota bacterium]
MKSKKPIFISIEGGEGAGKTTHCLLLEKHLKNKGLKVLLTREPGGTTLSESLRKILLHPRTALTPLCELFLYEAARAQHMQEAVLPALKDGKAVICDRFIDATAAYQGFGRKLSIKLIDTLNKAASLGIEPTVTIYLDINPAAGIKRARKLDKDDYGKSGDRIERENVKFHQDVRKGYLVQAKRHPQRVKIVKTQKSIEKTQELIRKVVDKALKNTGIVKCLKI